MATSKPPNDGRPDVDPEKGPGDAKGDIVEDAPATPTPAMLGDYEGAYRYAVIGNGFLILFISAGIQFSNGTYVRNYVYLNYFGPGTSFFVISFLGSLATGAYSLVGMVAGPLADFFGPRIFVMFAGVLNCLAMTAASFANQPWQMLLSQGLLSGIAACLTFLGIVASVNQYFFKKRGMAMGMTVAGGGVGGFCIALLSQYLIDHYGIPWSLRIMGLMALVSGLIGGFLIRERVPSGLKLGKKARGAIFDFSAFKNKHFVAFFIAGAIFMFGYMLPYIYLPSYTTSFGYSASLSSLSLGLINLSSSVGRVVVGIVGDKIGYLNTYLITQSIAALSVLLVWTFAKVYATIVVFACLYGIFAGSVISLMAPMMFALFGGGPAAVAMLGMGMSSGVVSSFAGPPIAGLITDANTTVVNGVKSINWVPTILL
ncbi:major facilitator superfamily domain-containing protein [Hyaloraphidium curvatum]|nr:major facilitator superfamily domain-containing protein [Hyaloraphidium curvatum]